MRKLYKIFSEWNHILSDSNSLYQGSDNMKYFNKGDRNSKNNQREFK